MISFIGGLILKYVLIPVGETLFGEWIKDKYHKTKKQVKHIKKKLR